jgi:hypothetical protein
VCSTQAVDGGTYGEEADVSPATASADLRRLLDSGFIARRGCGQSTSYIADEHLRTEVREASGG